MFTLPPSTVQTTQLRIILAKAKVLWITMVRFQIHDNSCGKSMVKSRANVIIQAVRAGSACTRRCSRDGQDLCKGQVNKRREPHFQQHVVAELFFATLLVGRGRIRAS